MSTEPSHNCRNENRTAEDIEKYGWSVIMIESTNYLPSFAYTIGLWEKFNHPEMICFGLKVETLHLVLNDAGEMVKAGKFFAPGNDYNDFFAEGNSQFLKVDQSYFSNYFGYAMEHYKYEMFPALQLIWTDRGDRFPWTPGFEEEFKFEQPLLDRNMDFKFREEKNLGIFTTRQWLDDNKPILRVIHDHDGDWQFLTGDQILDDARLVALEQMTKRDLTLNEVFNLDYGQEAERDFIGSAWRRSFFEEEVGE